MSKPSVEHVFSSSDILRDYFIFRNCMNNDRSPEDPTKHCIHNIYEVSQLLAAFWLQPTDPWHCKYPLPCLFPLSIDLYPSILHLDLYLKHC